jgi:taurine--2-oxoglutarate transaminase
VRDRNSREPISPWPEVHPALKQLMKSALERDVSFAFRGNLILLAPPLVIQEKELQDALSLLEELIGKMEVMK